MPKVTANGTEISYDISGKGTPVLFIHGGFGGPNTIVVPRQRTTISILPPDRAQTITYDRRSCGQSEYVLSDYTLPDLAADARALLEHLGVERSIVVGDSMGGMVALQYALTYPQHVDALALVETGADLMSETPWGKRLQAIVGYARSEGDRAVFEAHLDEIRHPAPPDMGPRPQEAAQRLQEQHEAVLAALARVSDDELFTYTVGALRNYAAFIGYDFTPRLGELKSPVCIIHGNADPTVPFEYGKVLHKGIPHAEFCEIEGGTHSVLDFPATSDALREWVLRVAGV